MKPASWHRIYWAAWDAVKYDRTFFQMGGEMPLTYRVIADYADRHGIHGEAFETLRTVLAALDDEWLTHRAEKRKQDEERQRSR